MFSGMSRHNVDAKGRIVMPAKFREQLGETFKIAIGFNSKCVQVMSEQEYERIARKIMEMPGAQANAMRYVFNVTVEDVTPNAQGRFVIPPELRKSCQLDGEVLVLGVINRVEIWNKDIYEAFVVPQREILAQAMDDAVF